MSSEEKYIETNKQLAALRQIHAAIFFFRKDEFECAITLAAAAEGLLPTTNELHLFKALQSSNIFKKGEYDCNLFINWLKHPIEPDYTVIPEFEVAMIIVRAISKFHVIYKTGSPVMKDFIKWAFEKGHLPAPKFEEDSN